MAGHAANGAFWISDKTGKWASSTFYKDYPTTISTRNMLMPLRSRLDTLTWRPSMDINKYPDIPLHRTFYPFKYTFKDGDGVEKFKSSALVNEEITSVAINCLNDMALGKRATVDMLNIAYTAAPYGYASDNDSRIELQDKYLRLDHQLERLFAAIEKKRWRQRLHLRDADRLFRRHVCHRPSVQHPDRRILVEKGCVAAQHVPDGALRQRKLGERILQRENLSQRETCKREKRFSRGTAQSVGCILAPYGWRRRGILRRRGARQSCQRDTAAAAQVNHVAGNSRRVSANRARMESARRLQQPATAETSQHQRCLRAGIHHCAGRKASENHIANRCGAAGAHRGTHPQNTLAQRRAHDAVVA